MLESGLLTQAYGSWRGSFENAGVMTDTGSAVPGQPFVSYCPDPAACTNGMYFKNEARTFDHREKTRDLSANMQWDATDKLHVNVEAQWIKQKITNEANLVVTRPRPERRRVGKRSVRRWRVGWMGNE